MKCFSVDCSCTTKKYETEFLPLLRRMSNLEELTLNISINRRTSFIDGPQIKNDLLVRLPRLSKFIFHVQNEVEKQHLPPGPLSEKEIQQSFADVTNQPSGLHNNTLFLCCKMSCFFITIHIQRVPPP